MPFLGAVTYGAQDEFFFALAAWIKIFGSQKIFTAPKQEFILGTVTYGAQEGHGLGVKSKILFMRFQK